MKLPQGKSAVVRVFGLPELFALILDCLPQSLMLQAQRISKPWRDHIISGKRLQEQLRLRPMAPDRRAECSTYNDLLLETLSRFFDIHKEPRGRLVHPHHDREQRPPGSDARRWIVCVSL